jgi:transposase
VIAAVTHDGELRTYYKKKLAEGKPDALVFNNVKNKRIQRVFAVIRRQTPYTRVMNYALQ